PCRVSCLIAASSAMSYAMSRGECATARASSRWEEGRLACANVLEQCLVTQDVAPGEGCLVHAIEPNLLLCHVASSAMMKAPHAWQYAQAAVVPHAACAILVWLVVSSFDLCI
ncbi:hypothetical protein HAX54_038635, partial [Datura stramonium]|nr:hypothetical protein [Datura stramonium]